MAMPAADPISSYSSAIHSALGAVDPMVAAYALLALLIGVPAGLAVVLSWIGDRAYRGQPLIGWARLASIPYLHLFQRLRVSGREHIPGRVGPNGLIVVANHGAGLDPVALQSAIPFPIRWMMSAEMMLPGLAWAWRRMRVIPVCYDSRDAAALKTAIAHVTEGGVLGIFPEGAIERPPRQLRPFSGGLRLILGRTRAPVVVAVIDPGRVAETAYGALLQPTRASVRFIARIEPGPNGHAKDTSDRIFALMQEATGWPVNDAPMGAVDAGAVERNLRAFANHGASA